MEDLLMPVLPEDVIIDIVSRLSRKVVCKFKCLSKSWLIFISSNSEFKRMHRLRARRRPPLLVLANVITHDRPSPDLFIEDDDTPLPSPMDGIVETSGSRKVVFNSKLKIGYPYEFVASCRDLLCFYNGRDIYVYSPSSNQYLPFQTPVDSVVPTKWRFGIVYVASMKLYKIVKLTSPLLHLNGPPNIRFEALTIVEEEEEGGGGNISWELITEHAMPSRLNIKLGNLIGVNGVAYIVVRLEESQQFQVISLNFESTDNEFKMFRLLEPVYDESDSRGCSPPVHLSQVKDLLCLPNPTTTAADSSIDLWMLKDRDTCTWFKGYTIACDFPTGNGILRHLVYFPSSISDADDDADVGAGLFLFSFNSQVFKYDIDDDIWPTYLFRDKDTQKLLVFTDNLYSLKNGLTCTPIQAANINSSECKGPPYRPNNLQHKSRPSLPQGSLSPSPPYYRHKLQHTSYSAEPKRGAPSHPLPPHGSLPPPLYNNPHNLGIYSQQFKRTMPQPPPPHFHHTPPQSSFPPPVYSLPSPPQSSLPPSYFHPSPPQGSLPPPYFHHTPPQSSFPPPVYSLPSPPQSSLPPPYFHPSPPQGSLPSPYFHPTPPQSAFPPLPPPVYSHPPPPQGSLPPPPPPLYTHPPPPQSNLPPPPPLSYTHPPPPQGSLPAPPPPLSYSHPPPPPYYPKNLQNNVYGLPPPPPSYYPQNLQHTVYSTELKRRKLHSSSTTTTTSTTT